MADATTQPTSTDQQSEIRVSGQDVNNIQADRVIVQQGSAGDVQANSVLISQAGDSKY